MRTCVHNPGYTGWDADGGYAEFTTVPAAFAHHLPSGYSDSELAPLMCAGIGCPTVRRIVAYSVGNSSRKRGIPKPRPGT
jgi:D-arabinose 1-dehydrogenase-like Zn-dependent alcohol dehydrogenase